MDTQSYNKNAWNKQVESGENRWTKPFDSEVIAEARMGKFSIVPRIANGRPSERSLGPRHRNPGRSEESSRRRETQIAIAFPPEP